MGGFSSSDNLPQYIAENVNITTICGLVRIFLCSYLFFFCFFSFLGWDFTVVFYSVATYNIHFQPLNGHLTHLSKFSPWLNFMVFLLFRLGKSVCRFLLYQLWAGFSAAQKLRAALFHFLACLTSQIALSALLKY